MNYSKDGITVAPMLDTTHPKKSGRCPVKIRVTYNRVRHYYPTGKDLTPEEWEMLPTTKARALVAVRKDIESSYQIVRAAVEELAASGGFSLDTLNNRLKGAAVDTVNTMFRAKIEELKKVGRVGSMLVYDNVLKGLERFAGAHIRFEAVTVSWLGRYADFLRKEGLQCKIQHGAKNFSKKQEEFPCSTQNSRRKWRAGVLLPLFPTPTPEKQR